MKNLLFQTLLLFVITASGCQHPSESMGMEVAGVGNPVISLNGTWKFSMNPPEKHWENSVDFSSWSDILVPGECQMQGMAIQHDKPYVYKTVFDVPADYEGKQVYLDFHGVYSYARVWVNGKFVREHQGGFTRWSCPITEFIEAGQSVILTVEITDRADDISYGSGYAKHQIGGILRKVELSALPEQHFKQFYIETDLDEAFMDAELKISYALQKDSPVKAKMELLDHKGEKVKELEKDLDTSTGIIKIPVSNPNKWDAEHPYLYTLVTTLFENGEPTIIQKKKIGFREVKLDGNRLLVNGSPVKLRGACRHDIHPTLGRMTTPDYDRLDVLLAKECNMNFIRTSHYPPSEAFLDYCDLYGIYVEDETAVCFVGSHRTEIYRATGASQNDPEFTGRYLSQLEELLHYHRNHPSVIIWSVGNENVFGDNFIQSIGEIDENVIIAGGMAGDNATFENTYVFTDEGITNNGAVGVSLNSDSLHVHTDYSFNWQPIGKELTITKSQDNIVYTIDNKTAYDTYAYFLGDKIAKKLPSIGIEFPLIISRKKMPIARAVLAKNSDGSLIFAGNLKEGEKVKIGFGNIEMILKDSYKTLEKLNNKPVESIFIYSCMARRRFMPKSITVEIEPLQRIAPTSGFFAYGEFCTIENKELLNQTMTILALSESSKPIEITSCDYLQKPHIEDTIEALSHIINTTTSELKATNDRLKSAIEGSRDGLWEWNLSTGKMYYSHRLKEMMGYNEDELGDDYKTWATQMHPDDKRKLFRNAKESIQNRTPLHCKHRIKHKNGKWIWVLNRGKAFYNEDGKAIMISGFQTDITKEILALEEVEKQKSILHHQAHHDALTELPNKVLFIDRLKQAIKKAKRSFSKIAVLFIDLDNFKKINDSMGHDTGDEVLVQVATRLQNCIRKSDTLARLGGDEFIIIIDEIKDEDLAIHLAQKLVQSMAEPLHVKGQDIYITNSVGVSIFPEDGYDANTLLKNADAAMYRAKDDGKNTYQFYKEEMTEKAFERLLMENSLRQALENEEFVVHYQPQVDTRTEKLVGMEALVRWNHPSMGLVPPSKFIPLAEETGLIVKLDRWVMKTAMKQISEWNSQSSKNKFLSLNLSMKQLDQKDFLEFIKKSLQETKCLPSFIELEITESQIMKDAKKCIRILEDVKNLGITISIDDFGTGYSSLSYLKRFPISKIKIDQSFVRDIPTDEDDVALVKAIIAIAKNLNLSTIAEGVETEEQREFMLKHDCDKIQGYFYSKPVCAKDMQELLKKGIN